MEGFVEASTLEEIISVHSSSEANPVASTMPMLQLPLIGKFSASAIRNGRVRYCSTAMLRKRTVCDIAGIVERHNNQKKYQIGQSFQLSEYELGCRFFWHRDNTPFYQDRRVGALIVQLSNSSEYQGGDLLSFSLISGIQYHSRALGSYVYLPGNKWHCVTKIQSGLRSSAVFWILRSDVSGCPRSSMQSSIISSPNTINDFRETT